MTMTKNNNHLTTSLRDQVRDTIYRNIRWTDMERVEGEEEAADAVIQLIEKRIDKSIEDHKELARYRERSVNIDYLFGLETVKEMLK